MSTSAVEQLAHFQSRLDQCAAQNDLILLESHFKSRNEANAELFANLNEQLKSLDKLAFEKELDTDMIKNVKRNSQRIDVIEIADRKKNLILRGIKHQRRLERPQHLDAILKKFFKETLGMSSIKFEEVPKHSEG